MKCAFCGKILEKRHQKIYCSNKCQADSRYTSCIEKWRSGEYVPDTKNISGYIKRYLMTKYNEKCSLCGWNETHPLSGKIPLEVDHIDGDSTNNNESNLRLLCPNCHSLTPFFRNLNKGRGRQWRKQKIPAKV